MVNNPALPSQRCRMAVDDVDQIPLSGVLLPFEKIDERQYSFKGPVAVPSHQ